MNQSAQSIAVRPLDKGMILDKASQTLEDGAFVRLQDFLASTEGPTRRPGYVRFAGEETTPYNATDFVTAWKPDGSQQSILITTKSLFKINPATGFTEVLWGDSGTGASILPDAATTFIFEDTAVDFTAIDIMVGDIIRITGTGEEAEITEILGATQLVVQGNLTLGTGLDYTYQRGFGPGLSAVVDWIIHEGYLLLVDGKRSIMAYDLATETIDYWIDDPGKYPAGATKLVAGCIASFQDRVWVGYIEDDVDGIQRQRIRWSALADSRNFSITTNYLDLPYVNGALRRLIPQNVSLVAYFDDGVYRGTQTNYPLLPVRFDPVETGGVGLVGMKAVNAYLGGHFFIGQDDIYFLSLEGASRIGTPIAKDSLRKCEHPDRCYVAIDPWNYSIVFGVPGNEVYMENLWRYNYKAQAWSYDKIQTYMIANPVVNASLDWDDLSGTTWDDLHLAFPTWDSINLDDPRKFLYIEYGGRIWKATVDGATDFGATPIVAELISKDHDLNAPDAIKTVVRLAVKIESEETLAGNLDFTVAVSTNRGRVWKTVGTLHIRAGYDEGYVNFRATGSTFRFRLQTSSAVTSYSITEYTMRVRVSGEELDV